MLIFIIIIFILFIVIVIIHYIVSASSKTSKNYQEYLLKANAETIQNNPLELIRSEHPEPVNAENYQYSNHQILSSVNDFSKIQNKKEKKYSKKVRRIAKIENNYNKNLTKTLEKLK